MRDLPRHPEVGNQRLIRPGAGCLRWTLLLLAGFWPMPVEAQPRDPAEVPELYLLIRSRRCQQAITFAESYVQTGQHQAALEALQWVLDQPHDVLIPTEAGGFRSARGAATDLLRTLPATVRDQYQRVQGALAAGEWGRAGSPQPLATCLDMVRTSFATEAGYTAASVLVSRWLDEGSSDLAAALALRVLEEPAHRRRLTPGFLGRAETACLAAGRTSELERLRGTWLDRAGERRIPVLPFSDQALPGAASSLSHLPTVEAVPLPKPVWQQPLNTYRTSPQWQEALEEGWREWSSDKRDRDWPTAVAWQPLVVGRQLLYRDLQTIRAIDVLTGDTLWRHGTRLGVEQLLSQPSLERSSARRLQWDSWESLFGNSLVGCLSSDGIRVYAIDQAEMLMLASRRQIEAREWDDSAATNALIAVHLRTDREQDRLAWTTARPEPTLPGHAYLGPPALAGGIAYVLAENDRELALAALEAATGTLLWRQPVALADRALLEDRGRHLRAAIPTLARGLALCPTNVGLLVAVDAVTGQLCWYHSCLESPADVRRMTRSPPMPPQRPFATFPPLVFVHHGKVVYLPSQSDVVYCLDVSTGRELWRAPQPDVAYVGGVTSEHVLVVGRRSCQSLALATGKVEWTAPLESVPAGTGVLLSDGFLLPLDSGKVAALELATGRRLGFDYSGDRGPMGHLVATPDLVVAVGGAGIAAYPTASAAARRLQTVVNAPAADPARALDLAAVHLAQGNLLSAVDALHAVIQQAREAPRRIQAERTLCEVYFQLLRDQPQKAEEWYRRLEPLCRTPQERTRRLISLSGWHLQAGRIEAALESGADLAQIAETALYPAPNFPGLKVASPTWLAVLERHAPPPMSLQSRATRTSTVVLPPIAEVVFRHQPLGRLACAQLAREDREAGRFHSAELRWLRNVHQSADEALAGQAARELAQLYDDAGLIARCADHLALLSTRFADVPLDDGRTGLDVVRDWPRESLSLAAWRRRQPIDRPIDFVRVSVEPRVMAAVGDLAVKTDRLPWDEQSEGLYGEFQRRLQPLQADAPYEWLIKTSGGAATLAVFDKSGMCPLRTIPVPVNALWPGKDIPAAVGSSQTFGVAGGIRCVSLLQGATEGLAWSAGLPGWSGRTSVPLCGPATPHGAVFQLRNELLIVDPADGRLLWHRDDLEPNSGLLADPYVGLLIDDNMVFVLGHDRQSYRVFELATGMLLREGRLDHDLRFTRMGVDNLIMHFTDTGAVRRLRVWNAAHDELLLDEPLKDRNLWCQVPYQRDVLWLTPEGRLKAFAASARRIVVDCPLPASELDGVTSLRAFGQGGRYFVNLSRNLPLARTENTHDIVREPLLPMLNMRDELIAVAPGKPAPLWRMVMPQRSMVLWGNTPAPLIVGVSIVKSRYDHQRKWMVVEAIDPATGLRVGYSDQLPEMRLYHADYDGIDGLIRLVGERGDVVLNFSPSAAHGR